MHSLFIIRWWSVLGDHICIIFTITSCESCTTVQFTVYNIFMDDKITMFREYVALYRISWDVPFFFVYSAKFVEYKCSDFYFLSVGWFEYMKCSPIRRFVVICWYGTPYVATSISTAIDKCPSPRDWNWSKTLLDDLMNIASSLEAMLWWFFCLPVVSRT